jgi:hypothetical protein
LDGAITFGMNAIVLAGEGDTVRMRAGQSAEIETRVLIKLIRYELSFREASRRGISMLSAPRPMKVAR